MVIMAGRLVSFDNGPEILTAIDEGESEVLMRLAEGQRVLEIGSAYGYSAITMARSGAEHVTTVDPHAGECANSGELLTKNIGAYDLAGRIDVITAYSQDALPELTRKRRRYGLVFVDGEHGPVTVRHDVEHGWKLLRAGGHLVCHDYGAEGCPGVREALDAMWPDGPDELVETLWIKRKENNA